MKPRFGKYRLIAKLAQGGMARLFLAEQSGLEGFTKKVVIKRMRSGTGRDSPLNAMFFTEAVLAGQLNHPNLVHVYDFAETDGERFIVMEYVDGPSAKKLLQLSAKRQTPLPVAACLKIVSLVCEGLAYAHEKRDERTGEPMKMVHRDITPDNILLSRSGAVKIADFGIVKAATQLHETQAGDVKGKLQYIAPEQLLSQGVDARADLFSLGVVLHELVAGMGPFVRENDAAVMEAIVHDEVPPLNELRPEAPAEIDAIIRKATAKQPDARYGSALELQEAVERVLTQLDPMTGPAQLRALIEQLDPAPPPGGEDETTTDAEALGDEPGTQVETLPESHGRAVTRDGVPASIDIPITGAQPIPLPLPRQRRRSLLLPIVAAIAATSVVTAFVTRVVVRELTPAVIVEGPVPTPEPVAPQKPEPVAVKPEPTPPQNPEPGTGKPEPTPPQKPEPVTGTLPRKPEPDGAKPQPEAEPKPGEPEGSEKIQPLSGRARVLLQSTPEANVWLDGKSVGRTPLALPVKFGPHKARFEDTSVFLNKTVTLNVPPDREYSKAFVFEKARLFVMAPDGATIYIGKKKAGRVPNPVSLYEGTYTVRVVYAPTELDLTRKLELKAGDRFEPFVAE